MRTKDPAEEQLEAIYAEVPDVGCKGLCWNHCTSISLFAAERQAIERATGREVVGERCDGPDLTIIGVDGPCPNLSDGRRCLVYEHRPIICRVFGTAEGLQCPHGCSPATGLLPDAQVFDLFNRVESLKP